MNIHQLSIGVVSMVAFLPSSNSKWMVLSTLSIGWAGKILGRFHWPGHWDLPSRGHGLNSTPYPHISQPCQVTTGSRGQYHWDLPCRTHGLSSAPYPQVSQPCQVTTGSRGQVTKTWRASHLADWSPGSSTLGTLETGAMLAVHWPLEVNR